MSFMSVKEAAEALESALKTVGEPRVYRDLGASIEPPGLVLGPPSLHWETGCNAPTSAQFLVFAVVAADEYAAERLWSLVSEVGHAVDEHTDAVVIRADPSAYPVGATDLAAYEIQVEFPLEEI